jgi:uncharacterized protein YggE
MKLRALASLVLFAFLPSAVAAQQTQSTPPGITVVATGIAVVKEWAEELDVRFVPAVDSGRIAVTACTSALSQLNRTLAVLGVGDSIVSAAVQYEGSGSMRVGPVAVARLHVPVERFELVLSTLERSDWKEPGSPKLVPRDADAANAQAYAAALANARASAGAIAAADGRRVGRLLNVQPLPTDFLTALAGSFASMATMMNRNAAVVSIPEVRQTATFTFELLP